MIDHTDFDEQVVDAIADLTARWRFPPTIRELMAECGVTSTSTMVQALDRLEQRGRIERRSGTSRALWVKEDGDDGR